MKCQEPGDDATPDPPATDSDLPACCICQENMTHSTQELLALECSHVFHLSCIEECWRKQQKPRYWCPYKCSECALNVEDDDIIVDPGNDSAVYDSAVGAASSGNDEVLM